MPTTQLPMASDRLGIRPPLASQIPVAEQLVQTLAQMLGNNAGDRIVLQATPSGILYTTAPRLLDVQHWTGVGANDTKQGSELRCSSVMVIGHPNNTGLIWVRPHLTATVNNALPVAKSAGYVFTLENLSHLHALIVVAAETLIVAPCL